VYLSLGEPEIIACHWGCLLASFAGTCIYLASAFHLKDQDSYHTPRFPPKGVDVVFPAGIIVVSQRPFKHFHSTPIALHMTKIYL
jgi:hypothetical protein